MKLITFCESCKNEIRIKSMCATRPDLQMEKGDELSLNCTKCGSMNTKHVNDIHAVPSPIVIGIGIGIGIVVTLALWKLYGAIGAISAAIPILFWQQQQQAAKSFNSYFVRRK